MSGLKKSDYAFRADKGLRKIIARQAEQITAEVKAGLLLFDRNVELKAENQRLKELLNEETMFEKIWQATKHWDLDNGRPIEGTDIRGYAGMTGDDVRVIIKAVKAAQPQGGSDE